MQNDGLTKNVSTPENILLDIEGRIQEERFRINPTRNKQGNIVLGVRYRQTLWETSFKRLFEIDHSPIEGDIDVNIKVFSKRNKPTQRIVDTLIVTLEKYACTGKIVDLRIRFLPLVGNSTPHTELVIMPATEK